MQGAEADIPRGELAPLRHSGGLTACVVCVCVTLEATATTNNSRIPRPDKKLHGIFRFEAR